MIKVNSEKFKVNNKNLIFKLTCDDVTGKNLIPIPLFS